MTEIPHVVPSGWEKRIEVGDNKAVLFYPDGEISFEHVCDRTSSDRGVIICAPRLQVEIGGHKITNLDPLTITPSILCSDCGTHGFVTEGVWQ